MPIAQAMENLAAGIRSATAARNAFITNLRQEVEKQSREFKKAMSDLHNENQRQARELRTKLTSEEGSRQNTARQESERRRVAVSESRSNTHSLLNRAHLERKDMAGELKKKAKALREKISSEERARIEAARQMMNAIRGAVNGIRSATKGMLGEVANDMRGARQAWAGVKKK